MGDKKNAIPENMSIEEASKFWDTHSVADYPSQVVKLEYTPEGRMTFIAIAEDLLKKVEKHAKKQGVSIESLINLWIQEKVAI